MPQIFKTGVGNYPFKEIMSLNKIKNFCQAVIKEADGKNNGYHFGALGVAKQILYIINESRLEKLKKAK